MLLSILIIFIVCWTPRVLQEFSIGIMRFAGLDGSKFALATDDMGRLAMTLRLFSYVNSIANVFIYYITSK